MKVGILGDRKRAQVWEKHLRPLKAVQEVVIASTLKDIRGSHCCILIDDSPHNLDLLADTIRLGIHSYLVAELPTDTEKLRKVHSYSQESDVRVQFSHWSSLSSATQWMRSQLPKPDFAHIHRESVHHSFSENRQKLKRQWIDELAWIIKWMGVRIHRIEADTPASSLDGSGIRIYIKFENGSTASLYHSTIGTDRIHRRIAAGSKISLDCNVLSQSVKRVESDNQGHLNVYSKSFDATGVAGLSAMLFFKAIKLGTETAFTPFDALQTSLVIKKIDSLLRMTRSDVT